MLGDVLAWLADHPKAFETAASRHLALSATALVAAMVLALPLALVLMRSDRAADAGDRRGQRAAHHPEPRAAGHHALPLLGTGFLPAVVALTLYGLPAILINTYTALREVDPDMVEAARGQGMTDRQVMRPHRDPARAAGDLRRHPHRRGADRVGGDAGGLHRRRRAGRADHRRHGHARHRRS